MMKRIAALTVENSTPEVTARLAEWIVGVKGATIHADVRREGVRTFVNWLGCAVGGADHETVDAVLKAVTPFSGPRDASVIGRSEKLDVLHAALVNGISSHVLDYDDTHLKTIIHPAGAGGLGAAGARRNPADVGRGLSHRHDHRHRGGVPHRKTASYPDHYDRGWHITGTAGVFGAAAAVGKAIGLSREQMQWALGLAATQAAGLREMFGTMTKSFHPGRAAQNGAMSAFLAEAGFDSSLRGIEAPRGFANVLSDKQDYTEILDGLGEHWEAGLNSYKPFACGIVIHPTIDGCLQLREELGERVGQISAVHLTTHPLVLELTGKTAPKTGLEAKFSVYHAAACALLRGDGAPTAFTDEVVNLPELVALRQKVKAESDSAIHEASVTIRITFEDGSTMERHIERAIGSRERPLSDEHVSRKFTDQAALVVGEKQTAEILKTAWRIAELSDAGEAARVAASAALKDAAE